MVTEDQFHNPNKVRAKVPIETKQFLWWKTNGQNGRTHDRHWSSRHTPLLSPPALPRQFEI
jgi:hypothetical protein